MSVELFLFVVFGKRQHVSAFAYVLRGNVIARNDSQFCEPFTIDYFRCFFANIIDSNLKIRCFLSNDISYKKSVIRSSSFSRQIILSQIVDCHHNCYLCFGSIETFLRRCQVNGAYMNSVPETEEKQNEPKHGKRIVDGREEFR